MFLIVPKHKYPHSGGHTSTGQSSEPSPNSNTGTRSSAACTRCRLRKVKCNGQDPCLRCRQSNSVCVYSKTQEAAPVPGAYAAMLETQQRRLVMALKNMSNIIEGRRLDDNDAEAFDIAEILERYGRSDRPAPASVTGATRSRRAQATQPPKNGIKRSRCSATDGLESSQSSRPEIATARAARIRTTGNAQPLASSSQHNTTAPIPAGSFVSLNKTLHAEDSESASLDTSRSLGFPQSINSDPTPNELFDMIDWEASWESYGGLLPLAPSADVVPQNFFEPDMTADFQIDREGFH